MASNKVKNAAADLSETDSENEDENLILGNDNAIEGYQQNLGDNTEQKKRGATEHNIIHLHF